MVPSAKALPAGRFSTREELTCHVWSIRRQQLFPNAGAIAQACGITADAVKKIIITEEGLTQYLQHGCPTGGSLVRPASYETRTSPRPSWRA